MKTIEVHTDVDMDVVAVLVGAYFIYLASAHPLINIWIAFGKG